MSSLHVVLRVASVSPSKRFMRNTVKSGTDISLIFDEGRRFNTPYLTLIVLENQKQHDHSGRVAFIAGKKNGNAVWRNKAKRRMRAICKDVGGPFPGYDVVFLAKKKITGAFHSDIVSSTIKTIEKAGIARN